MNTVNRAADWLYSLTPYQLTCVTVAVLAAFFGVGIVIAFFVLAAKSGAGEGNPEEAESETHQPEAACLRSVCAWCEPNAIGENITHGICPEHAEAMTREAKLTKEYGPLK